MRLGEVFLMPVNGWVPDEGSICICRLPVRKEDTASIDEALKAAEWLTKEELQQEQQKIIASWRKAKRLRRIPGSQNDCIKAGHGAYKAGCHCICPQFAGPQIANPCSNFPEKSAPVDSQRAVYALCVVTAVSAN